MIPVAIKHQFEFWRHIGQVGGYFHQYDGFSSLSPKNATWPSKIFDLNENHIEELKCKIMNHHLSRSLAVAENEILERFLRSNGFTQTSSVTAMTKKIDDEVQYIFYPDIIRVTSRLGFQTFAKIASAAFGYSIYDSTIQPLIKSKKVQLFLGKHQDKYVSCGIVFMDSNGDSGLHMIGAKKEYRGLGLGKKMTQHLLSVALRNNSNYIHLVASKLGAPIYHKLGFEDQGYLQSYTI
ncbi:GNAT family N-acetyltransferase [Aquimarina litoralis]|uniref:GNAT family N-acetyltransferase n=1 Tax=Aquimarina litoralis TaxID=584605 RepID=UPI001C596CFE|nr:GNAT family N-acetyltransferase [Aquimarina litoralis]MBW1298579.1 GNAT family N-acetyltransferase [Aquimarina litoralis]